MFQRYAAYFTPTAERGSKGPQWLGWDILSGVSQPHPEVVGVDLTELTESPRKYGLHGTVKPPFFLADGEIEADFKKAFKSVPARGALDPLRS